MKKRSFVYVVLLMAAVLTFGLLLGGCGSKPTFDGSKTGDADHYDIEFDVLNTTFTHELVMEAGESLEITVECTSGDIALLIQSGDNEPAYRGNKMDTTNFVVGINEAGTYTISVTGDNAKGHVVVTRK